MTIDKNILERVLTDFYETGDVPSRLAEAATYSLTAGGKRLRPTLLLTMLEAYGCELTAAHYQVAAALEMLHTGSLIHDDLPAMDDDDYRRGEPTSHVRFDEATAILAGDTLFLDPYLVLADSGLPDAVALQLVRELAYASGAHGMVAGQMLDMAAENQSLSLDALSRLQQLKTGRMLTFPFVAAGIIAARPIEEIAQLRQIGATLGLAFQIRDDVLDVTSSFVALGKTPGKDVLEGKSTYVSLLGLDAAKKRLTELLREAVSQLTELDRYTEALSRLITGLELP